jgi:hypothetical protein
VPDPVHLHTQTGPGCPVPDQVALQGLAADPSYKRLSLSVRTEQCTQFVSSVGPQFPSPSAGQVLP